MVPMVHVLHQTSALAPKGGKDLTAISLCVLKSVPTEDIVWLPIHASVLLSGLAERVLNRVVLASQVGKVHAAVMVDAVLRKLAVVTKDGQANCAALLSVEVKQDLRAVLAMACAANRIPARVLKGGLAKTVVECCVTKSVLYTVHAKALVNVSAVQDSQATTVLSQSVIARMVVNAWHHTYAIAHQNGRVTHAHSPSVMASQRLVVPAQDMGTVGALVNVRVTAVGVAQDVNSQNAMRLWVQGHAISMGNALHMIPVSAVKDGVGSGALCLCVTGYLLVRMLAMDMANASILKNAVATKVGMAIGVV